MPHIQPTLLAIVLSLASTLLYAEERDADRIMELEANWSDMFGEKDLDGIMALMADNSVLIMPGAEPIVGVEAIRAATRAMFESEDSVSWRSDHVSISASGDMAFDYGTATTTRPDGSSVTGYYLVVWVREDGEWKVAADMFN